MRLHPPRPKAYERCSPALYPNWTATPSRYPDCQPLAGVVFDLEALGPICLEGGNESVGETGHRIPAPGFGARFPWETFAPRSAWSFLFCLRQAWAGRQLKWRRFNELVGLPWTLLDTARI